MKILIVKIHYIYSFVKQMDILKKTMETNI